MHRKLALLALALAPAVATAQSAGAINFTPQATFGQLDCRNATVTGITIAFNTGVSSIPSGATYQVQASNTSGCPTTASSAGVTTATLKTGIVPGSLTESTHTYPDDGSTVFLSNYVSAAGFAIGQCTTGETIYVCVNLMNGSTSVGTASGTITIEVTPPSIPVLNNPGKGNGKLYLSWKDGTDSTVVVDTYNILAVAPGTSTDTGSDSAPHSATKVTGHSLTLDGLTNGVTYDVSMTSVSAGGNESRPSNVVQGRPEFTSGFWENYVNAGGVEEGGCAGGAGGLLSLAVLVGLGRAVRRRS
jgi:hypothetical protein